MPVQWNTGYWDQYGSTYTLAGVIQGEASSSAGQFAVASTIQNRIYGGFGDGSLDSVVRPSQFNGFQTPTPQSMAYAQAIQDGTLSDYGNTGNATYYAAPSTSNAPWANPNTESGQGLFNYGDNNVGGNYYSDKFGPPSDNFQKPIWNGTTPPDGANQQPDATQEQLDNQKDREDQLSSKNKRKCVKNCKKKSDDGSSQKPGQPMQLPGAALGNKPGVQFAPSAPAAPTPGGPNPGDLY